MAELELRGCPWCRRTFTPTRRSMLFCCADHRQRAAVDKWQAKNPAKVIASMQKTNQKQKEQKQWQTKKP